MSARVAEWLDSVERGRYSATDLRSGFVRDTGENVTAKEFGLALRAAGAVSRRGGGGERTWDVRGGTPGFRDWLLTQDGRDDPVGDLARDYRGDPDAGATPETFRRRLRGLGVSDPVLDALSVATSEWTALRLPGSAQTPTAPPHRESPTAANTSLS